MLHIHTYKGRNLGGKFNFKTDRLALVVLLFLVGKVCEIRKSDFFFFFFF